MHVSRRSEPTQGHEQRLSTINRTSSSRRDHFVRLPVWPRRVHVELDECLIADLIHTEEQRRRFDTELGETKY
jgi:hypothetical protein